MKNELEKLLNFVLKQLEYIDSGELAIGPLSRKMAAATEIRDEFSRAMDRVAKKFSN